MNPDEIKILIKKLNRRLQKLRERRAVEGISVDAGVLLEIEDIELELEKLQTELQNQGIGDDTDVQSLSTEEIIARTQAILDWMDARLKVAEIEAEIEIIKAKTEAEASQYRAVANYNLKQVEVDAEAMRVNQLQAMGLSEDAIIKLLGKE